MEAREMLASSLNVAARRCPRVLKGGLCFTAGHQVALDFQPNTVAGDPGTEAAASGDRWHSMLVASLGAAVALGLVAKTASEIAKKRKRRTEGAVDAFFAEHEWSASESADVNLDAGGNNDWDQGQKRGQVQYRSARNLLARAATNSARFGTKFAP